MQGRAVKSVDIARSFAVMKALISALLSLERDQGVTVSDALMKLKEVLGFGVGVESRN